MARKLSKTVFEGTLSSTEMPEMILLNVWLLVVMLIFPNSFINIQEKRRRSGPSYGMSGSCWAGRWEAIEKACDQLKEVLLSDSLEKQLEVS